MTELGRIVTPESRKRMSEAHQFQAEALRGVPRPEWIRAKIKATKAKAKVSLKANAL